MAEPAFTRSTIDDYKARLTKISVDSERQWGSMDATRMLRHLRFVFEASMGEEDTHGQASPGTGFLAYIPGAQHLIYVLTFKWFTNWPKGNLKAPDEWTPTTENTFDEEEKLLLKKMDQFVDELEATPDKRAFSPLLGNIPLTKWSVVHGAHTNHHLKQFGI